MIVTVVGAGGKTTICIRLGESLALRGRRVLFTTTTQIYRPENYSVYIGSPENITSRDLFMAAGKSEIENGKLKGFSGTETDEIEQKKQFDYIIVEGDGAKCRSVKAPAEWEPVYPGLTSLVLGVIGLDSIGKPVCEENVHRNELFMDITGSSPGEIITAGHLFKLIHHPLGLFRHAPQGVAKVVLLNKADLVRNYMEEIKDLQRKAEFPLFAVSRETEWTDEFIQKFILIRS